MHAHIDAHADINESVDRPITLPWKIIRERYLEELLACLLGVKENTACIGL